jgi:hypothetical protein
MPPANRDGQPFSAASIFRIFLPSQRGQAGGKPRTNQGTNRWSLNCSPGHTWAKRKPHVSGLLQQWGQQDATPPPTIQQTKPKAPMAGPLGVLALLVAAASLLAAAGEVLEGVTHILSEDHLSEGEFVTV